MIQAGQGTSYCSAGIFNNIISNVTKNEEAGHGPVRVPRVAHLYIKGWLPSHINVAVTANEMREALFNNLSMALWHAA